MITSMERSNETAAALATRRGEIEAVDLQIIALIAERVRLAREVGRLKRATAQPLLDPAREAAVVRRAAEVAADHGVHTEPVRNIFWQLIGLCRSAQHQGGEAV